MMKQLEQMGFADTPKTRKEILENKQTQVVTMYHAFLRQIEENKKSQMVQRQKVKKRSRRNSLPHHRAEEAATTTVTTPPLSSSLEIPSADTHPTPRKAILYDETSSSQFFFFFENLI